MIGNVWARSWTFGFTRNNFEPHYAIIALDIVDHCYFAVRLIKRVVPVFVRWNFLGRDSSCGSWKLRVGHSELLRLYRYSLRRLRFYITEKLFWLLNLLRHDLILRRLRVVLVFLWGILIVWLLVIVIVIILLIGVITFIFPLTLRLVYIIIRIVLLILVRSIVAGVPTTVMLIVVMILIGFHLRKIIENKCERFLLNTKQKANYF